MTDLKLNNAQLRNDNQDLLAQIIDKLSSPNGFAKLSPQQRRLLLAAVLSSIVPADSKVRKVEMEHLEKHLSTKFQFAKESLSKALSLAHQKLPLSRVELLSRHLSDLLSIEDRTKLIGMLRDIALCDQELHPSEEALIYKIADVTGVMRKRVVEQQAIASSRSGMRA